MGQIGIFSIVSKRYTGLDAKNEPLAQIDEVVPWEDFRGCLDAVSVGVRTRLRKSRAGRKPWDAVVMFKPIILSALYNLSDDQGEHQIRNRLSFMRFLGLDSGGPGSRCQYSVAVQRTVDASWGDRDLIRDVRWPPEGSGLSGDGRPDHATPRSWRCPNSATIAARSHAGIKAGETPECWQDYAGKARRQKDVEARWTKKHGRSHYGYKNHVNVDRSAQAGAALSGERRGDARQQGSRRYPEGTIWPVAASATGRDKQTRSVGGDRGDAERPELSHLMEPGSDRTSATLTRC